MSEVTGIVTSAELCTPLDRVKITHFDGNGAVKAVAFSERGAWRLTNVDAQDRVVFAHEGFLQKKYLLQKLPDVVRLLENRLIGYQEKLWFLPGQTVNVFAHSSLPFSATLYRHGLIKEPIRQFGPYQACTQQAPDGFFVESGLNWQPTFSYQIPTEARPGLYSLLLWAEGQEPFAIPFVVSTLVRQNGASSKLLVLASTNNWQSYNIWGGRSRYRNFEEGDSPDYLPFSRLRKLVADTLPKDIVRLLKLMMGQKTVPAAWQFRKLSIRRPFTNCSLEEADPFRPFCNHLAGGEWRLLAWLEREMIPYDIVSGYELHSQPDLLHNYRAVIFSTHCEYWSREMYEGVKTYHEQNGLWLVNISGNTMFREIEFFEDGSTRCVSLFFAESCADETQLLGVRFSESDYGTCAPYKIIQPDHWAFDTVPFRRRGQTFGGLSLNQNVPQTYRRYDPGRPGLPNGLEGMGASGWETDKLSKTAPDDIEVIAQGTNRWGGADMVIREPDKNNRGGMFSASSLTFSGALLIDNVASTIVRNVISKALEGC